MSPANLTLRPAQADDCEMTWSWANDPATRQGSFSTRQISQNEHAQWFNRSLSGERQLLIAEIGEQPVGLLRFDPIENGNDVAEVGITVAPEARGKGIACSILEAGTELSRTRGISQLVARIRIDNPASVHTFERAGYSAERTETVAGVPARRYIRSISDD